ncbi:MAG TPA: diaminobutyrate--2-oxoglutarate transaminase [Paenibacillus sp.]|uniref:diaminobutyrate--2-oxoglutarate transaminase n=1 Tax=Paenibacillus sp. TaxID=58172 RepID=UPI0028D2B06A|nr:diaminobutyrate--2-oxoglutarate transaminase [Paenibacillus sp.]HUC94003.1 diaminobutyrate--2-oxoglutarate transaminase [Paenibacillus sp.]
MSSKIMETPSMEVFETRESEVRSYCRSFATVFQKAKNAKLWDTHGTEYIDFFAGAGALNYGHNNEVIRSKLIDYMLQDGVTHSLDMATSAKEAFLNRFHDVILQPRGWNYKVMFPGPTGTNSVESAMKIARKVTGRCTVMCFTNAFHGMTLGSLSVTGNAFKRNGAGVELGSSVFMPYDGYFGSDVDTTEYIGKLLDDPGSGIPLPAAVIVEAVQGEGGLNAAGTAWLQKLERLCRQRGILLILDDIQMGCGRTGSFFSFDDAGIEPDIVCLSKSIGGFGLPMAITLLKPEIDVWQPGEHNGTFRGNNLGFVAAAEALSYWESNKLELTTLTHAQTIRAALEKMTSKHPELRGQIRGKGMIQGIAFDEEGIAERLCAIVFEKGLIMETSGPRSEVAKLMPPLTIERETLVQGLGILEQGLDQLAELVRQENKTSREEEYGS